MDFTLVLIAFHALRRPRTGCVKNTEPDSAFLTFFPRRKLLQIFRKKVEGGKMILSNEPSRSFWVKACGCFLRIPIQAKRNCKRRENPFLSWPGLGQILYSVNKEINVLGPPPLCQHHAWFNPATKVPQCLEQSDLNSAYRLWVSKCPRLVFLTSFHP